MIQKVAVYCGSSKGSNPIYVDQAKHLAQIFYEQNLACVFGAGSVGLMGEIADKMVELGGKIIGVIPQFLVDWEVCHPNLTETIVTQTMHERKQKMCELADAFIALPGGFGTLDELFEILTWAQLDLHQKPIGLLNVNHFFDSLISQLQVMVEQGFLKAENLKLLIVEENLEKLLTKMNDFKQKTAPKWIK